MQQEIPEATAEFTVVPSDKWREKVRDWHERGLVRAARHRRKQQAGFIPLIMAPKEMEADGKGHQFAAAMIPLDRNTAIREATADHAREIMTLAELQGLENREDADLLAFTLAAVTEGNLSLEMAMGVFMDKYAKFTREYNLKSGQQVRNEISALLGDGASWTVPYIERGKNRRELLPVAVRNWIAHMDGPNSYTREQVVDAISLLDGLTGPTLAG